jgi:hypothetical protein
MAFTMTAEQYVPRHKIWRNIRSKKFEIYPTKFTFLEDKYFRKEPNSFSPTVKNFPSIFKLRHRNIRAQTSTILMRSMSNN